MESKLVSIIVPCYNVEKYLFNCFYCLDSQTYKNIEIIFVDDGSYDRSGLILDNYCKTNNNARVIHKKNGGISSARNAGLDVANGEYIYFYDSDDILNKDIIKNLVKTIENANAQLAISHCKKINDGRRLTLYTNVIEFGNKVRTYDSIDALSLMTNSYKIFTSVWNKLYLASVIKENNLRFDETCLFGEDTPFNYNYLKLIRKTAVLNKNLYYYVQRKNSLVHQKFKESRLTVFNQYNKIINNELNMLTPYIHLMRLYNSVECLYFIKKSNYDNANEINKILAYLKQDLKYIKQCRRVKGYRKMLLPATPNFCRALLRKRLKPKKRLYFAKNYD